MLLGSIIATACLLLGMAIGYVGGFVHGAMGKRSADDAQQVTDTIRGAKLRGQRPGPEVTN